MTAAELLKKATTPAHRKPEPVPESCEVIKERLRRLRSTSKPT
jgi:hypothetical protein